jgi:hypothetical protein
MFDGNDYTLLEIIITLVSSIITAAATIYAAKIGAPKIISYVEKQSCLIKLSIILIAPFVTLSLIVFIFFAFLAVMTYFISRMNF